jgi:WD40 repeat protein
VAFSEDGTTLVTGGDYPNLHSWDAEAGTPLAVYAGHTAALTNVGVFDADRLISSSADGSLKVWQRNPPWQLERTIGSVDQPDLIGHRVLSLDFNPDSSQLLVAGGVPSRDGELQIFSVANGTKVTRFANIHSDVIHAARFSPDGKRIATASADKYTRTLDAATGLILLRFEGHTNYVLSVAWKGDGQTLVTSGADNAIKVWDVATADQKRTIDNGFSKAITKVEYIGETDNVVSCSGDRSVRFHNAENGGNIRNFNGAKAWLHCVDVSADGGIVATGGEDGKVLIWNGNNSQLLHTLEFSN